MVNLEPVDPNISAYRADYDPEGALRGFLPLTPIAAWTLRERAAKGDIPEKLPIAIFTPEEVERLRDVQGKAQRGYYMDDMGSTGEVNAWLYWKGELAQKRMEYVLWLHKHNKINEGNEE